MYYFSSRNRFSHLRKAPQETNIESLAAANIIAEKEPTGQTYYEAPSKSTPIKKENTPSGLTTIFSRLSSTLSPIRHLIAKNFTLFKITLVKYGKGLSLFILIVALGITATYLIPTLSTEVNESSNTVSKDSKDNGVHKDQLPETSSISNLEDESVDLGHKDIESLIYEESENENISAEELFSRAKTAYKDKEYDDALLYLNKLQKLHPTSPINKNSDAIIKTIKSKLSSKKDNDKSQPVLRSNTPESPTSDKQDQNSIRYIQFVASTGGKNYSHLSSLGEVVTEKVPNKNIYRYKIKGRFDNEDVARVISELKLKRFSGAFESK
ncbi:MAG: hypothetical protein ACJA01_004310 [Saprospiraceae bacterium]|jgi:hypothetical protein